MNPATTVEQDAIRLHLESFRAAVWGDAHIFKKEIPSPSQPGKNIDYLEFDHHSTAMDFLCPAVQQEKLLVFEEYLRAMEAFNSDDPMYALGAYIVGQPGIGKSMFLAYAIIERLREEKPVAVQVSYDNSFDNYVLLSEDGVAFYPGTFKQPLREYGHSLWAFSDSGGKVFEPPYAFQSNSRIRVFQATSPARNRWHEWTKQSNVDRYIMDIPSMEEIKDLAHLLEFDGEQMESFAARWGCVPRTVQRLCESPKRETGLTADIQNAVVLAAAASSTLDYLHAIVALDIQPFPGASMILFTRPNRTSDGIDRTTVKISVPTEWLTTMFANELVQKDDNLKREFFKAMATYPGTRQAAGYIYEKSIHCFLLGGTKSFPISWYTEDEELETSLPNPLTLPDLNLCITHDEVKSSAPFYWCPSAPNYPGIDGAIVTKTHVLVVQMTISSHHKSPQKGIDLLWNFFPATKRNLQWGVVFIGPEEAKIKAVAEVFVDELRVGRRKKKVLPVGQATICPTGVDLKFTKDLRGACKYDPEEIVDEEDAMDVS